MDSFNDAIGGLVFTALPLLDALSIPGQITENLNRVVQSLTGLNTVLPVVLGAIGPVEGIVAAVGDSGQAFVDALGAGDAIAALNALANTPAVVTGALLNGYTSTGGKTDYPGLLSVSTDPFTPAGLVQTFLVTLPRTIATALTPPAETSLASTQNVTAVPEVDNAKLVSLSVADDAAPASEVEPANPKSGNSSRANGHKAATSSKPGLRTQAAAVPSGGVNSDKATAHTGSGKSKAGGGTAHAGAPEANSGST